ncbi:MAG: MATE family efflux transporter, partial [Candidatus Omnitrophica bacterium]|nr:MATE family efflux transporter [Candidatus Omnitrophota bacterium]
MQPETSGIGDKVVRNTAYNIIGRMWFFIVGFFLTPYIVGRLGVERYAVWALVGVVTNYFGLLDFGVGSSFVKYVSEFHTIKEYSGINKLVNTGFAFYVMLGAGIVALAALFVDPLMSFLKIPAVLH